MKYLICGSFFLFFWAHRGLKLVLGNAPLTHCLIFFSGFYQLCTFGEILLSFKNIARCVGFFVGLGNIWKMHAIVNLIPLYNCNACGIFYFYPEVVLTSPSSGSQFKQKICFRGSGTCPTESILYH